MTAVVVDTHAAIWYLLESPKLSPAALAAMDNALAAGNPIYVASISLVEIIYLVEKGRLPQVALDRLLASITQFDVGVVIAPLNLDVAHTVAQIPRDTVPDMPDRNVAATAVHLELPLITRDREIRSTSLDIIW